MVIDPFLHNDRAIGAMHVLMMPVGIIGITVGSADAYPDVHPRGVWTMMPVRPLMVIMMMDVMLVMLMMLVMVFVLMVPLGAAVVA
jgi:hypothetical protein